MVSLTIAPLLKTYDKHWEFYYWGFPPLGLFVVLTAALVYTGILTWEDPIGKMLDEGAKKTGEVASVVSNKEATRTLRSSTRPSAASPRCARSCRSSRGSA